MDSAVVALTEGQQHEAAECIALLQSHGRSLRTAVNFYLAHLSQSERSAQIDALVAEFTAAKAAANVTAAYLAPLKSRLKAFCGAFGDMLASNLGAARIEDWLVSRYANATTRNNVRRNLSTLFAFALARRYITENPVKEVARAKEHTGEIEALTVIEVRALLAACDATLLPFIAIGAFAGSRRVDVENRMVVSNQSQGHRSFSVLDCSLRPSRRFIPLRLTFRLGDLPGWPVLSAESSAP